METLRPISVDTSFSSATTVDPFVETKNHLHLSPDSVLTRSFSVDSSSSSSRLFLHRSPWRPPSSLNASPFFLPRPPSQRRSSSSPREIAHKYLYFWVPLYRKVKAMRTWGLPQKEEEDARRRRKRSKSGRKSDTFSTVTMARTFDAGVESSIHDAVLHCKKSIGRED